MPSERIKNILDSFKVVLFIIAILWIILVISFFLPGIKEWGIRPRTVSGLVGIICAPFLHENMGHLIANSASLFVLGSIFINVQKKLSFIVLMHFFVIGGFGTWLIGRSEYVHIGASGIVYAIMGYLIFSGIFNRTWSTLIISALVLFFYSSAIWGILPGQRFISWESHLCGFIAGIITAKAYARK